MPNPYFQFKQFTVYQDKCAMKVGTDGVLLGAMTPADDVRQVLDVGTGTGIVALMIAQRSKARITAIEIDLQAVVQAQENVDRSPWKDRISVVQGDYGSYDFGHTFDCIVSNPPYFDNDLKCPESQRNMARHTDTLSFDTLLRQTSKWLSDNGTFTVILPTTSVKQVEQVAQNYGLYASRRTAISARLGLLSKRMIVDFIKLQKECRNEHLTIEDAPKQYNKDFFLLMRDFYLHL